jgi:hypothetical protein
VNRAIAAVAASSPLLAGCIVDIHPSASWCEEQVAEISVPPSPEFHRDVRPILRRACVGCHRGDGLAGFGFDTYAEAAYLSDRIGAMVASGQMPPWKPARCCADYRHDGSLSPEQRAVIEAWVEGGAPEGEFVEPPALEARGLSRVDLEVAMPRPYLPVPPAGGTDETRCFLLDWPLTETTYVTGLEVVPGNPAVVHHALVLVASADQAKELARRDADDDELGWSCPGGIVLEFSGYLGGWTPGFTGADFPASLGQRVPAGSKLVLTVHYSLHDLGAPDQTAVRVKLERTPTRTRKALGVFNPVWLVGAGFDVPAGASDVVTSYVYDPTLLNGGHAYELHAVNLHMHERGSRGLVAILRADGSEECLLQIDDWDHAWQGDYVFGTPKTLRKGDRLSVECHFDNTAGNQRIVNGVPETPRDLSWAEDEEMCVAFVTATPIAE